MRRIKIYPERLKYRTGETVSGYVEVLSDKDFDFTEMYVELVCREHSYFTVGSGDDEETYREEYFHHSERNAIMEPGEFQQRSIQAPFSFKIPEHLPTSYDGASGWIEYTLDAKIGVKWRLDSKDRVPIVVIGREHKPHPESIRQSLLDDETILLDLEIDRDAITLGEDIVIKYRIDEMKNMRGLRFDLVARELVIAQRHSHTSEKVMATQFIDEDSLQGRSWTKAILHTDERMLASYKGPLITLTILLKAVIDIPWRKDKDLTIEILTTRSIPWDDFTIELEHDKRDEIFG